MLDTCFLADEKSKALNEEITLEQQAINHFEKLVASIIENGTVQSRQDALNHIMTTSTCNGDWADMCGLRGLPYDYFSKTV